VQSAGGLPVRRVRRFLYDPLENEGNTKLALDVNNRRAKQKKEQECGTRPGLAKLIIPIGEDQARSLVF
jgi:hypothetical protein